MDSREQPSHLPNRDNENMDINFLLSQQVKPNHDFHLSRQGSYMSRPVSSLQGGLDINFASSQSFSTHQPQQYSKLQNQIKQQDELRKMQLYLEWQKQQKLKAQEMQREDLFKKLRLQQQLQHLQHLQESKDNNNSIFTNFDSINTQLSDYSNGSTNLSKKSFENFNLTPSFQPSNKEFNFPISKMYEPNETRTNSSEDSDFKPQSFTDSISVGSNSSSSSANKLDKFNSNLTDFNNFPGASINPVFGSDNSSNELKTSHPDSDDLVKTFGLEEASPQTLLESLLNN